MNGSVVVRPVHTAADLEAFIALPYRLFRGDPYWVPLLRMDVRKLLSRSKNPFFQHADAEYFLALKPTAASAGGDSADRDGASVVPAPGLSRPPSVTGVRPGKGWELVGRIAAIHNRAHNEFHDDRVGFFGFFECVDDQQVANRLFEAAANWLRSRSLTVMRGPASPSTNDECGLLVWGFDTPPTILNPHNPAYYQELVERAGFAKARDLLQFHLPEDTGIPERIMRAARLLADRKRIRLRSLDMKHFDEDVERIKRLYNAAWEKNWGFVPMTDAEIDHLAKQLKPVVVPDLVVFAERDGETIGFAAALPDLNVALRKNPSGRLLPGIIKILWAARKVTRLRILLLGLLKEYRMTGADALMFHWIWEKGEARGFSWAEAGWILEENTAMFNALGRLGFAHYKTLRMYDRAL